MTNEAMKKNKVIRYLTICFIIFLLTFNLTPVSICKETSIHDVEKPSLTVPSAEQECDCGIASSLTEPGYGGKTITVNGYTFMLMEDNYEYLQTTEERPLRETLDEPPADFSWKNHEGQDWTTPAKNQMNIGTCWAFAAVGALEASINIQRNIPDLDFDLSEQYLVSCLRGQYQHGIIPEWAFPYQNAYVDCPGNPDWNDIRCTVLEFGNDPQNVDYNITAIKNRLMEKGPLVTRMSVSNTFAYFWADNDSSDLYYPYEPAEGFGHEVLLVGWHDDANIEHGGYWICKNSWATWWGYDGFFNIEYDSLNIAHHSVHWITSDSIVLYVDDSNTQGPWIGSIDHPFQTIQEGINHAWDNDTIYVFNGTYNENVYINKTIKLIGEDKNTTIVDGDGTGDVMHIPPGINGVTIRGFTIQHAGFVWYDGVHIASDNNFITNNIITDNPRYGIFIHSGSGNTISKNIISDTNDGDGPRDGYGIVDYHFERLSGNTIIIDNMFIGNDYGVDLSYSTGTTVSRNTISDNRVKGVALWYADNNTITGNTVDHQMVFGGITLIGSNGNTVSGNTVFDNEEGIWLQMSCNNIVSQNYVFNNVDGVYLDSTSNANLLHHNIFFNNEVRNAYDSGTNTWDNGYPSGGNYWDDYEGADNNHGENQDIPPRDGIGDISYSIPGGQNIDQYPIIDQVTECYYVENILGTIQFNTIEGGFYGIVAQDGRRFDPTGLPTEYRVNGLNCEFSGRVVDVPDFHMWGENIYILSIQPRDTIIEEHAIIRFNPLEGGFYYLDVVESSMNLLPLNLPANFRDDGMGVQMTGYPWNVQTPYMFGQPFYITSIVDTTPPETRCQVTGNIVTLIATDFCSGVTSTIYSLAVWQDPFWAIFIPDAPYQEPFTVEPGRYQIYYYSIDNANNIETSHSLIFDVQLVLVTPNGGEIWGPGHHVIEWVLAPHVGNRVLLSASWDSGHQWHSIASVVCKPGVCSYQWDVPMDLYPSSTQYRIRVHLPSPIPDPIHYDISDSDFTLLGGGHQQPGDPREIAITSPNGGEVWKKGTTHDVTWYAGEKTGDKVNLFISFDSGKIWKHLCSTPNKPGENTDQLYISKEFPDSSQCLMKIVSDSYPEIADQSKKVFTVTS